MKHVLLLSVPLAMLLAGCDGNKEPLLSHGKSVDYWLQELAKADSKARKKAVIALGHVGTADAAVIPALIKAVKDRDAAVRKEAVLALLNIGPDAEAAIPVLTEAQNDKDATIRAYAVKAIRRIHSSE